MVDWNDPEEKRIYARNYYRNNPEKRAKKLAATQQWKNSQVAAGFCTRCKEGIAIAGLQYCRTCALKTTARNNLGSILKWKLIDELLKEQQYRCFYTKLPIDIGNNASLEHILPVSTHPELKHDITNLRWVHLDVNNAKRALSISDFVELCKAVVRGFGYIIPKKEGF